MATRYSKEKYVHIKGMKKEPLSQLAANLMRRKLNEENGETLVSSSIQTIMLSPTPSLEVMAITPLITSSKGNSKIGKSVCDDLATALGWAHNMITNDDLKGLTSIPSHELVSPHIHKLEQVVHFNLIPKLYCSHYFDFQFFLLDA